MKQNTIQEIGEQLLKAKSVLLFPHDNADGDALGSSAALCRALQQAGKEAAVLLGEKEPDSLHFLNEGCFTLNQHQIPEPDICMCVDCGEPSRFLKRKERFFQGKTTICLDHHVTSEPFADYNHIDGTAAATAELVYKLLVSMGLSIDKITGEALFAGICTDTGNFQYSNTTKESHLITAALYDAGIDHAKVAVEIYQNMPLEKFRIVNKVLGNMELFADGKAALAYVTQAMLRELGACLDHTEGCVEALRNIKGVEVAAFVKEKKEGLCKVSMRAKSTANVAKIAAVFGGGGHVKAAGCTLEMGIKEACGQLKKAIEENLEPEEGSTR